MIHTAQMQFTKETGWTNFSEHPTMHKSQLVLMFGDTTLLKDPSNFNHVKNIYKDARIVLSSTAGEIMGTHVFNNSIVVTALFFETTTIEAVQISINTMEESQQVGQKLGSLLKKEGLVHALVLAEGININGTLLVKGLTEKLPSHVVVTGGLSGDQDRFKETVVGLDQAALKNTVVLIGFYGSQLKVGYGSMGGWDSFGPDRLVTKSHHNILYEIDGQSALTLYKKYLGEQAKGLPATGLLFPLSLQLTGQDRRLVRTILAVDEQKGSMTFAGDIPEGSYVRLMKANFERLVDGAANAATMSYQSIGSFSPQLAILISCVGRKLVLKQRIEDEVESVQQTLGEHTVLTGFYSYGEICPLTPTEKQCELHNQTMTITVFSET